MARELFIELPQGEVCGPLGPVLLNWPATPVTEPTVFLADRLDGLVLRQPHPQGIAAALISPRQILDRLGEAAGATFSLRAAGGWMLIGEPGGMRHVSANAAIVSRPVPGWPIAAEAVLDARMLRDHIASRAALWISLWVLAFIVAIRAAPGLVRSRWYRLRRYPNCIVGSELTDWLVATLGITRRRALRIGQRIVARGWLVHVAEEHDFEDGRYFYRLVPQHAQDDAAAIDGTQEPESAQVLGWLQGPRGVSPGFRAVGLLLYRSAVTGHEIVEALERVAGMSRERAASVARHLLRVGLLRHVHDECGFEDSRARLYTFT